MNSIIRFIVIFLPKIRLNNGHNIPQKTIVINIFYEYPRLFFLPAEVLKTVWEDNSAGWKCSPIAVHLDFGANSAEFEADDQKERNTYPKYQIENYESVSDARVTSTSSHVRRFSWNPEFFDSSSSINPPSLSQTRPEKTRIKIEFFFLSPRRLRTTVFSNDGGASELHLLFSFRIWIRAGTVCIAGASSTCYKSKY